MIPRTANDIAYQIAANLTRLDSPITDFSKQSVAGTLLRGIGIQLADLELLLSETISNTNLTLAGGDSLDTIATQFGVVRKRGTAAAGFALFSVNNGFISIPPGFLLIDTITGIQFIVNTNAATNLEALTEIALPIIALDVGEQGNLTEGSSIYPLDPSIVSTFGLRVVIGSERKYDGQACGNLEGGSLTESDTKLRERLYAVVSLSNPSSATSIRQKLLEQPMVDNAWVETVAPGIVKILVKGAGSINDAQLKELRSIIESTIPIGVVIGLTTVKPYYVDLSLKVILRYNQSLGAVDIQVKDVINNYISSLNIGQSFIPQELITLLSAFARQTIIESPDDTIQPSLDSNIQLNSLNIQYVT